MFEKLLDDPTLIAGLCDSTDEAYTQLFEATFRDLRRYFERWKFADADPADLAQMTLLKLYKYDFKKYKRGSLAALVTTFAKHVRVDQFRKAKRRGESIAPCDQQELCSLISIDQTFGDEGGEDSKNEGLAGAVASLSEAHREILERSVLATEPMREIAKDLGISIKGAYARRYKALEALRNALKD